MFGYDRSERQNLHIVFDSLAAGSVVTTGHIDGRVIVRNSSQATILIGFLGSLQMTVEGTAPQTGLLGILSRVSALDPVPLIVRDNRSLIMTDWYNEQSRHLSLIEGRTGPSGYVVVDHTQAASTAPVFMEIDGYRGLVAEFGGMYGVPKADQRHTITVRNGGNLELIISGSMFWLNPPRIVGSPARTVLLGNSISGGILRRNAVVQTSHHSGDAAQCARALDHFRTLGIEDLRLNYDYPPA